MKIEKFSKIFQFWLGGAAPQTPQILAGEAKPPQDPPLTGLAGGLPPPGPPAFFFSPLTTRAPPGRPAGRPAERPAGCSADVRPDVQAAPVSSEAKKRNAGGLGGGSPLAKPVKGGVWAGEAPPAKIWGVWEAAPPSQNQKFPKIF